MKISKKKYKNLKKALKNCHKNIDWQQQELLRLRKENNETKNKSNEIIKSCKENIEWYQDMLSEYGSINERLRKEIRDKCLN